ncbi:MAG: maleylacetate reductase [Nitriliruptoraceae bacterium]|nr:maleylacetate reductase [Nitriliruptoraceae bacterium]
MPAPTAPETDGPPGPRFVHDALPGRIVFGAGRAQRDLSAEVERLGGARVLVLTTARERRAVEALTAALGERVAARFNDVRPHVPVEVATQARALAATHRVDLLLAVGGGSAVGTAKAVALTTGLPILAVPTTYAGSEVTPIWGLTEDGRKTTGRDEVVLPRTVIYDAALTTTLPATLSAVSGLNAVAHAIEAFWAPGRTPVADALAETSIRSLARGLPGVVADGADLGARGQALLGAWLAAASFAVAGSGLHHKICHVLGGAFDLPHAQTHAIVLPHVLALNAPYVPGASDRIAGALGAEDAVTGLGALARALGAPDALRDVGLEQTRIDEVLDDVVALAPSDNPAPVDRDTVRALILAAWAGPPG